MPHPHTRCSSHAPEAFLPITVLVSLPLGNHRNFDCEDWTRQLIVSYCCHHYIDDNEDDNNNDEPATQSLRTFTIESVWTAQNTSSHPYQIRHHLHTVKFINAPASTKEQQKTRRVFELAGSKK